MTPATLMMLVATASGAGAPAALDHAAEVKLFASTIAIVQVVTAACPDLLPNAAYLAGLRDRLHMTDADKPAFADEDNAIAGIFGKGVNAAPSRGAWCVAALRLYGLATKPSGPGDAFLREKIDKLEKRLKHQRAAGRTLDPNLILMVMNDSVIAEMEMKLFKLKRVVASYDPAPPSDANPLYHSA